MLVMEQHEREMDQMRYESRSRMEPTPPTFQSVNCHTPTRPAEQDKMYHVEREGLCSFFVEGAPATITHNIETGRGLVNGCKRMNAA